MGRSSLRLQVAGMRAQEIQVMSPTAVERAPCHRRESAAITPCAGVGPGFLRRCEESACESRQHRQTFSNRGIASTSWPQRSH